MQPNGGSYGGEGYSFNTFLGRSFPTVRLALNLLCSLSLERERAFLSGAYGWGGGALKTISEELEGMKTKHEFRSSSPGWKYSSHLGEDVKECIKYGKLLADKVRLGR